jgi:hypothetical protein
MKAGGDPAHLMGPIPLKLKLPTLCHASWPGSLSARPHPSQYAMGDVAFSSSNWIGTSEFDPFRSSILGPWTPL